ncbi:MAG: response regulator transcription factor [Bacteroidetes bacterium]|nr:response regulator transcription factor [Bacteroidota bacterium]
MIKVFITDDHAIAAEGIRSLLQHEKDIECLGYAPTAAACLEYLAGNTADIILMDINMPDMSGIDLCKAVKQQWPGIAVLGLSTYNQNSYVKRMLESGASGYILKNADKRELSEAIHAVYKGNTWLSEEAEKILKDYNEGLSKFPVLTRREKEVLALIAEGFTNPEIAQQLFVSQETIDSHRKNLLAKLKMKNTAMLIKFAVENGLI